MGAVATMEVIQSPAIALLNDLTQCGFEVVLSEGGMLSIAPRSRLTSEQMQTIARHKDALKRLLVRRSETGVSQRREVFAQQLARTPSPRVPAFLFTADVVYAKGTCFSCGDALSAWTFGRCWRCSLAWRLACRVPIDQDVASALDESKVVG